MGKRFFGLTLSPLPLSICFLGAMLLALCFRADAQQEKKVARIGFLTGDSLSRISERREAFREGLRESGYIEGKNIVIEWRSWERKQDGRRPLAAELVRLKPDVIVAVGSGDIRAVKDATATIPIVMVQGGDAVGSGFVASLAHPGGNTTGLSTLRPELVGKRLELLKDVIPGLSRVAVFATPNDQDYPEIRKALETAGGAFGVKLQFLEIRASKDIATAFGEASKSGADAVLFRVAGPFVTSQRPQIADLAVKHRLAVIYERVAEVEGGGLMSYGVVNSDMYRRAAIYVGKILKGAKPADLPVEQPTKFEFVINLKAAKQISLTIPPNVLARADRVIR